MGELHELVFESGIAVAFFLGRLFLVPFPQVYVILSQSLEYVQNVVGI
jgi:hypothetical protein